MASHDSAIQNFPIKRPYEGISVFIGHMRLGAFRKLPKEIREQIFELAIDAHKPIAFRRRCGSLSQHNLQYNDFAQHRHRPRRRLRFRFALLWCCRTISQETQQLIYRKVTLHIISDSEVVVPRSEMATFMIAARFRNLEITVSPIDILRQRYMTYSTLLSSLVDKIVFYTDGRSPSWEKDDTNRRVVLNLGRMFEERLPFNVTLAEHGKSQEPCPPLFVLEKLDEVVKVLSRLNPRISLTITAMTQLSAGREQGQSYLDGLRRLVGEQNVVFLDKTSIEYPRPEVLQERSRFGATHTRFV